MMGRCTNAFLIDESVEGTPFVLGGAAESLAFVAEVEEAAKGSLEGKGSDSRVSVRVMWSKGLGTFASLKRASKRVARSLSKWPRTPT